MPTVGRLFLDGAKAIADERQEVLRALFDTFRVDTDTRRIVTFKPKKDHAALFRAAFSKNGSDGARTRDLCLDRAAC